MPCATHLGQCIGRTARFGGGIHPIAKFHNRRLMGHGDAETLEGQRVDHPKKCRELIAIKIKLHIGGITAIEPKATIMENMSNTVRHRLAEQCVNCRVSIHRLHTVKLGQLTKPQNTRRGARPIIQSCVNKTTAHDGTYHARRFSLGTHGVGGKAQLALHLLNEVGNAQTIQRAVGGGDQLVMRAIVMHQTAQNRHQVIRRFLEIMIGADQLNAFTQLGKACDDIIRHVVLDVHIVRREGD